MHTIFFCNKFIIFLYMFRAQLCSSSGGQIVLYSIWCILSNWPTQCTQPCFMISFFIFLYMFRALLCSSSGGQIVLYSIWCILSNWPTQCTQPCFMISLLYSSTCFEHCCGHHQEVKLYYRARGNITLCRWPSGAPDGHLQRVTIPDAV